MLHAGLHYFTAHFPTVSELRSITSQLQYSGGCRGAGSANLRFHAECVLIRLGHGDGMLEWSLQLHSLAQLEGSKILGRQLLLTFRPRQSLPWRLGSEGGNQP